MKLLVALTLLASHPVALPVGPLAPLGKWVVEYDDSMCVLRRPFGESGNQITWGLRPWPLGEGMEIVLLTGNVDDVGKTLTGKAQVSVEPSGEHAESSFIARRLNNHEGWITTLTLEASALSKLPNATQMTISLPDGATITVLPTGLKKALVALNACEDDLLKHWGVDPREADDIATPAKLPSGILSAFNADAYPSDAVEEGAQGTTTIIETVDTQGRVSECRVVNSSGNASLDKATCKGARTQHYNPAIGKDGQPVSSHQSQRVTWMMPQTQ